MNGSADQDAGFGRRIAKRSRKQFEPDFGRQLRPLRHCSTGKAMTTAPHRPARIHQHLCDLHHGGDASGSPFPHDRHGSLKAVHHGERTLYRRARFPPSPRDLLFQNACLQRSFLEELPRGFGQGIAIEHVAARPAGGNILGPASSRPVKGQDIDCSRCIADEATRRAMPSSIDADGSAPGSKGHDSAKQPPVSKVPSLP